MTLYRNRGEDSSSDTARDGFAATEDRERLAAGRLAGKCNRVADESEITRRGAVTTMSEEIICDASCAFASVRGPRAYS